MLHALRLPVPFVMIFDFVGCDAVVPSLLDRAGAYGLNALWALDRFVYGRRPAHGHLHRRARGRPRCAARLGASEQASSRAGPLRLRRPRHRIQTGGPRRPPRLASDAGVQRAAARRLRRRRHRDRARPPGTVRCGLAAASPESAGRADGARVWSSPPGHCGPRPGRRRGQRIRAAHVRASRVLRRGSRAVRSLRDHRARRVGYSPSSTSRSTGTSSRRWSPPASRVTASGGACRSRARRPTRSPQPSATSTDGLGHRARCPPMEPARRRSTSCARSTAAPVPHNDPLRSQEAGPEPPAERPGARRPRCNHTATGIHGSSCPRRSLGCPGVYLSPRGPLAQSSKSRPPTAHGRDEPSRATPLLSAVHSLAGRESPDSGEDARRQRLHTHGVGRRRGASSS